MQDTYFPMPFTAVIAEPVSVMPVVGALLLVMLAGVCLLSAVVLLLWWWCCESQARLRPRHFRHSVADIDGDINPPVPGDLYRVTTPEARVLGRRVGERVRMRLGYPKWNPANVVIVAQQVDQELDTYKDLRLKHRVSAHAHAVRFAFQPSKYEIQMVEDMQCEEMEDLMEARYKPLSRVRECLLSRVLHRLRVPDYILGVLFGTEEVSVDF